MTIIGGVSGVGLANCFRTNYSETYLPCNMFLIDSGVKSCINQTTSTGAVRAQPLMYIASARIRNVADTEWIDIGEATYFQVNINPNGSVGSAQLTVKKPETWSPYISGGTYEDALKPSTRKIELQAGLIVNGVERKSVVFLGCIKNYSEAHGANSGSITLYLEDIRDILLRDTTTTIDFPAIASYGRAMLACAESIQAVLPEFSVTAEIIDQAPTTEQTQSDNLLHSLTQFVAGSAVVNVTSTGSLSITTENDGSNETGYAFEYNDSNMFVVTRNAGAYQYNVIQCVGLSGGVVTVSEVADAADIAKRGRLLYSGGFIGSTKQLLSVSEATAAQMLANAARGNFTMEIPMNPFLRPGMRIKLSSARLGIAASYGRVGQVRHQCGSGRARTYLDDIVAVPL